MRSLERDNGYGGVLRAEKGKEVEVIVSALLCASASLR